MTSTNRFILQLYKIYHIRLIYTFLQQIEQTKLYLFDTECLVYTKYDWCYSELEWAEST